MNVRNWLAILTACAGCGAPQSKSAPTEVAAPTVAATPAPATPTAPTPTDDNQPTRPTSKLAPELAALRPNAALQAGPFEWPKGGTSAIVGDDTETALVWKSAAGADALTLPRGAARVIVRDIDGDGAPELVIFAKPPTKQLEWFEDPSQTWIVTVGPKAHKPVRMWLTEYRVLGANDEASLDRELAAAKTFGATKDTPLVKLIVKLPVATTDELKALVGPKGLKLCHRQGAKRTCKPVAQKAIDAKRAAEIAGYGGAFGAFASSDEDDSATLLQQPACNDQDKPAKVMRCGASVGGPLGGEWVFEKTASGWRLSEVGQWAEDS